MALPLQLLHSPSSPSSAQSRRDSDFSSDRSSIASPPTATYSQRESLPRTPKNNATRSIGPSWDDDSDDDINNGDDELDKPSRKRKTWPRPKHSAVLAATQPSRNS